MYHILLGMTVGYITATFFSFAFILQVFIAHLRSELIRYFQKPYTTCKSTPKTKHHVGIIKLAVFPNSWLFLLAQKN